MTSPDAILPSKHLLGIDGLSPANITALLDLADTYVGQGRGTDKKTALLQGRTLINLFFEASTRTQSSFELAGKRLGADVMNMSVKTSSVSKGETLLDTASTLNAMRPDILVVRHQDAGAAELLSRKLDCSVINAGDGAHEHLPRRCWMRSPSAAIAAISKAWWWRSAATYCTAGWRAPTCGCFP